MPTQKKIEQVAELKERIGRATITVGADYRGLRVQEMDALRRRLREAGIEVRVIKNSLLKLAADQAEMPDLMEIIEGPTALAFAYDDPMAAAKVINEYAQSAPPTFAVRGAYLDGHVVSADDLRQLVRLPARPVMIALIAGQLQSPLAGLLGLLQSPLRELASLLQATLSELPGLIEARAGQMEAMGLTAEPPAEAEAPEPQAETPAAAAEETEPQAEVAAEPEAAAEEPALPEAAAEEPAVPEAAVEEPALPEAEAEAAEPEAEVEEPALPEAEAAEASAEPQAEAEAVAEEEAQPETPEETETTEQSEEKEG